MKKNLYAATVVAALFSLCSCNSNDGPEPEPVGDEWLDPEFGTMLQQLGYISDETTATPTDIKNITELKIPAPDAHEERLTSLRGIEYFTGLKVLKCNNHHITELDLSHNQELVSVNCSYNDLTSLNISGCSLMDSLDCSANNLTTLDITSSSEITYLNCSSNALESLDLSNAPKLDQLYCYTNKLTDIDLSHNTALTWLFCYQNLLQGIDISHNTNLEWFYTLYNPGKDGFFVVKAWFEEEDVPDNFTYSDWKVEGEWVIITYEKAI